MLSIFAQAEVITAYIVSKPCDFHTKWKGRVALGFKLQIPVSGPIWTEVFRPKTADGQMNERV